MRIKIGILVLILTLLVVLFPVPSAKADVAPPQQPPGSAPNPGGETQVRMLSELVNINVLKSSPSGSQGQAAVNANFVMRNLGSQIEHLNVRFPLSDPSGMGDGFGGSPEIRDLRVKVNGGQVKTGRITTSNEGGFITTPIPWSSFPVTFPPGEDVSIEVNYTLDGTAHQTDSVVEYGYILATGAGWKDTIGSADIVVHLPYDANPENVSNQSGFQTDAVTITPEFSGQEVRWHLEDFEPDSGYNFRLMTVKPDFWLQVLNETKNVTNNPNDAEAWGRLGRAYKNSITDSKGFLRDDFAVDEIFQKSSEAYEKAVALKPDDALWHYGYAELLWLYYSIVQNKGDYTSILVKSLTELDTSLRLAPTNEKAMALADWINGTFPDYVEKGENGYVFLALTQTPVYMTQIPWETPTTTPFMPKASPSATKAKAAAVATPTEAAKPSATSQPAPTPNPSGSPICGGSALALPALVGAIWLTRRKGPPQLK